jgi:hypothetical protein
LTAVNTAPGGAWRTAVLLVSTCVVLAAPRPGFADAERETRFSLRPGAVELGFGAALSSVEGDTRATVSVLGTTFLRLWGGLAGLGADVGYTHVHSLDILDLEAHVTWQKSFRGTAVYPYVGAGGGLRQEWLGSFRTPRYPVGVDLGFRVLVSPGAALRTGYRWRRVLGDPVSNFSEHRLDVGFSVLFRNEDDRQFDSSR